MNIVDEYIDKKNWERKENANSIHCVAHMMNFITGGIIKDYWLSGVFDKKVKQFHDEGKIYCHDLKRALPYCAGFSTSEVIKKGIGGVKGRITSSPPKHFTSTINQITNFVGIISQEYAGAIALNDFSLYLAPFVYYDKLTPKQVKQGIQELVFHLNQPNRFGGESPFTNLTIQPNVPKELKDTKVIIGGEEKSKTYGEFETEMNIINDVLLQVLIEGDANGTPMTFPVITIGIDKDFPWDSEISRKIFQTTAKYGTPFFENFMDGTGRDPEANKSLCCRLSLSLEEVKKHTGGIFGHNDSMGSLSVVTINLNRIGYLSKNKIQYYSLLDEYLDVAKLALVARRKKVNEFLKNGLYPYTKYYLKDYKNYFNTIGVIGGNESMINFMEKDLMQPEAITFMEEVIDYIVEKCKVFQKETGDLWNCEAVPGESCMHSLALKDVEYCKGIYVSGGDAPFLTNSTQPPVEETNFLKVIQTQETLQTKYTGGTVMNIYIGERMDNYLQAKLLVKNIIENTKIPYFSITPVYSICQKCGYIPGEKYRCPVCKRKCEVFSRVVGYLKPLQQYNKGKISEFKQRKYFDLSDINQLEKR